MNRTRWEGYDPPGLEMSANADGAPRFIITSDEAGSFVLITPPDGCTGAVEVSVRPDDDNPARLTVAIAHDGYTCPIHEGHDGEVCE